MVKVTAHISGLKELEAALGNLPGAVAKNVTRAALRKAAAPMAAKAKELAPDRSGKLQNSIKIGTKLHGRQQKLRRALTADERAAVELFIGPSYLKSDGGRHGHLVEFGTAPHKNGGKFKGTMHPGTAPQPFMRPAWEAEKGPTLERIKPLLYKAIARAAKREAAKAAKPSKKP